MPSPILFTLIFVLLIVLLVYRTHPRFLNMQAFLNAIVCLGGLALIGFQVVTDTAAFQGEWRWQVKQHGWMMPLYAGILALALLAPLFNFRASFRQRFNFQILTLVLFVLVFILQFYLFRGDMSNFFLAGTRMIQDYVIWPYVLLPLAGVGLNFLLVNRKVLPEFQ